MFNFSIVYTRKIQVSKTNTLRCPQTWLANPRAKWHCWNCSYEIHLEISMSLITRGTQSIFKIQHIIYIYITLILYYIYPINIPWCIFHDIWVNPHFIYTDLYHHVIESPVCLGVDISEAFWTWIICPFWTKWQWHCPWAERGPPLFSRPRNNWRIRKGWHHIFG